MIAPGAVLRLRFALASPAKEKYAISVDPPDGFFLINTREPRAPGAGVRVGAVELRCLQYDSFIDTGKILRITDAGEQLAREPRRHVGRLPQSVRDRVKVAVQAHGILPPLQEAAVLSKL